MGRHYTAAKRYLILVFSSLLISACGGGSGGSDGPSTTPSGEQENDISEWQKGVYPPVEFLANRCASPRSGSNPFQDNRPYLDQAGNANHEKMWLRSWSNDIYLWYDELPDLDPQFYTTDAYFDRLKTDANTDSGRPKDRFHFSVNTRQWQEYIQTGGTGVGYGMTYSVNDTFSRSIRVSYVEPDSPADEAGIERGTRILSVAGLSASINTPEGIEALEQLLFPNDAGEEVNFVVQHLGEDESTQVELRSENISINPVLHVQTFERSSGTIGYLLFNDHIATAETELKDAIEELSEEGVDNLILDLRYNSGGIVAIASQLAYMIVGDELTTGETFELFEFNDKYQTTHPITGNSIEPTPFLKNTVGLSETAGESLPSLNLPRVYVISSEDTCSASEALINGLRGIGIKVILIGGKTCGKPFGFYGYDNCGTTYFTIQFRGVNAEGYGGYSDGFSPAARDNDLDEIAGCSLQDDLNHDFTEEEANIATALYYIENGTCPTSNKNKSAQGKYKLMNKPEWRKIKVW